ncbi:MULTISPECIES: hypothetical protein [Klebsiella]|nr:hypothetical protein [Klebsiella pneumoniae]MCK9955402.1 hypothetical protein [Klebsiella pneumoniae]MDZ1056184.1 hypothetical protein [Klebsiella pneumoniae]MDZ1061698.1 hypothetical protein [Klebsiella pneumoniae]MDZ1072605.1 hypothetical protein [Klebsiella pneumoniae]MDZ1078066.1 hypothetical protein [Klebsiella pneumoniae]
MNKTKGCLIANFATVPEELRAELRYLRAENAYLKKLKALVQSEKNGKKP